MVDLPDSPAGRQAAWFFQHVRSLGAGLGAGEVAGRMLMPPPWEPEESIQRFTASDPRPFDITKVVETAPYAVDVTVDYHDGKPMTTSLTVENRPPHRIVSIWWARAMPDDVVIRRATPADSAALNDLEVRAPMTIGASTLVYDRGEDFLGFSRLMAENLCFVAERDGELVGLACGASHPCRVGGSDYTVMLLHHLRVPVEHRKGGIFSNLNGRVFGAYESRTDGAYGYTALDNAEAMRIGGPGTWKAGVFRAVLACGDLAGLDGSSVGRPASAADAALVVDVLNRGHEGEEMYLPYTVASLTQRMTRASDLYTWDNLLIGDRSVLGVWPAGMSVTLDGHRTTRGVVLDHGFLPGAANDFERLLKGWCGRLVELGHTELTFLTSTGSASFEMLSRLAGRMDPFAFRMAIPEPEGTVDRGLYVDAVYF